MHLIYANHALGEVPIVLEAFREELESLPPDMETEIEFLINIITEFNSGIYDLLRRGFIRVSRPLGQFSF